MAAQADPTVAGAAAPASGFGNCPDGWFCAWENNDGTGHWFQTQRAQPDLRAPIGGFVFDDQISSFYNRTNVDWCAYVPTGYQGQISYKVGPGESYDLHKTGFGDRMSSLRPRPANKDCLLPD